MAEGKERLCQIERGVDNPFAEVLRQLCLHGRDLFVNALMLCGALKSARLAFRALQETVDYSISRLYLRVGTEDSLRLASQLQHFPLCRWPRLTQLRVCLAFPTNVSAIASLVALPFTGQPADCLQRIRDLELDISSYQPIDLYVDGAIAVASLLYRAGRLHRLHLGAVRLREPLPRMLLGDALSSLTELEDLSMRGFFLPLPAAHAAGRLKYLEVWLAADEPKEIADTPLTWLSTNAPSLRALETAILTLRTLDADIVGKLLQVLHSPPPRLRAFQLRYPDNDYGNVTWRIAFAPGGYVAEAHQLDEAPLSDIAEFARQVLLPLGRPLDLLHLSDVVVDDEFQLQPEQASLQRIRTLANSSRRVQVDCIRFGIILSKSDRDILRETGFDAAHGLRLLQALGTPESVVVMNLNNGDVWSFKLRLGARAGATQQQHPLQHPVMPAPAPTLAPPAVAVRVLERDWPTTRGPGMVEVASQLALQRLAAGAFAGPPVEAQHTPATVGAVSTASLSSPVEHLIVQLQSPSFAIQALASAGLHRWMKQLAKKTSRFSYLHIPSAAAVLVECRTAEDAEEVAAAARATIATGHNGSGTPNPVQLHSPAVYRGLGGLLEKAGQAFWESGVGGSETERLRLLLQLGFALATRSPVVDTGTEGETSDDDSEGKVPGSSDSADSG